MRSLRKDGYRIIQGNIRRLGIVAILMVVWITACSSLCSVAVKKLKLDEGLDP